MEHTTKGSEEPKEQIFATSGSTGKTDNNPTFLWPAENTWISTDEGTTFIADPKQGEAYDFCITIRNKIELNSGPFIVKFVLSGDQDPPLELSSEEQNLAPGESALIYAHYGAFENKFGIYHVGATVYAEGKTICSDQGFDFTINSE